MKILEVSSSGTIGVSPMGPVSNVVAQLAIEFQRLGQDTTVADVRAKARGLPVPTLEIDLPLLGRAEHSFAREERFVERLLRHDLGRFDIVHVHDWRIAHALHRQGVRTVYTAHTPLWIGFKGLELIRDRLRGLIGAHERAVIRDALLTIALGDYLRVLGANVAVIPSGIRAEQWIPDPVRNRDFTIVCMARLAREKGVHVLVEALRRLKIPYKAVVVGSRVGRFEAENGRSTRYADQVQLAARGLPVTFTGFIPNTSPEFRRHVGSADVVVVPSLFDAQGTVVLEALSMGVPVVGSRVGGIPMMVTEDVGKLVVAGDSAALADALTELYLSPERRAAMAARARPHVLQRFSWDACARRHIESFERVRRYRAEEPRASAVLPSPAHAKKAGLSA